VSGERTRHLALLATLAALILVVSLLSEHFLSADNLFGMTRHLAEIGIVACGMTLVLVTGGIDLSVGSLLALSGIVLGYAWRDWGIALPLAALLALAVGAAGGALNGLLIARAGFPPLVVTLGTMALYRGLALRISEAQPVSGFPAGLGWLGQGHLGPVPVQTLVWGAVVIAGGVVLHRTPVGLFARAIGDNPRAARFAALPVERVTLAIYTATGLLAGLAALISTARFSTARADAGAGFELEVITAVVLGGTAITGGRGTALGTLLGVLILGVARNGMTLAGVEQEWRSTLTGAILIGAAIIDAWAARRAGRSRCSPETLATREEAP
jgi:rhamnose transport system permease protein